MAYKGINKFAMKSEHSHTMARILLKSAADSLAEQGVSKWTISAFFGALINNGARWLTNQVRQNIGSTLFQIGITAAVYWAGNRLQKFANGQATWKETATTLPRMNSVTDATAKAVVKVIAAEQAKRLIHPFKRAKKLVINQPPPDHKPLVPGYVKNAIGAASTVSAGTVALKLASKALAKLWHRQSH